MISWLSWYRYCDCLALCLFVWGCDRWTGIIVSLSYIYRYFALDDNHVKCYYSQILSSIIHSILNSQFSNCISNSISNSMSPIESRTPNPYPITPKTKESSTRKSRFLNSSQITTPPLKSWYCHLGAFDKRSQFRQENQASINEILAYISFGHQQLHLIADTASTFHSW